jgi:hypothetical protein
MATAASYGSHNRSMSHLESPRMNNRPSPGSEAASMTSERRHEFECIGHPEQAGNSPGRHLAHAIAGNNDAILHCFLQRRCGRQRLNRTKDLTGTVAMDGLIGFSTDIVAEIGATK